MSNTNNATQTNESNVGTIIAQAEIVTPVAEIPLVAVVHENYDVDVNFMFLV